MPPLHNAPRFYLTYLQTFFPRPKKVRCSLLGAMKGTLRHSAAYLRVEATEAAVMWETPRKPLVASQEVKKQRPLVSPPLKTPR